MINESHSRRIAPVGASPAMSLRWFLGAVLMVTLLGPGTGHAENAQPGAADGSLFDERWKLADPASVELFDLMAHRATWILPFSYNQNPNPEAYREVGHGDDMDRAEFVYQLSFKTAIANGLFSPRDTLWAGYTQKAYWQAYNTEESVPFREIDHEPELIYAYRTDHDEVLGLDLRMLSLRLNHISNGRSEPLSQTLNRVGAGMLFDQGWHGGEVIAWVAIPENGDPPKSTEIVDYYGRLQVSWYWQLDDTQVQLELANNLSVDDNHARVSLGYTFPIYGELRGYLRADYGYGDGLIDYDHQSQRLSAGVMLVDWY